MEELGVASGPDPRIGMVLQDRYRIVRLLGEGGMGAVYEGEHMLIKKQVAIKCLHAQFAQNPEIVARFHREALAATSIGHANIIEVTDLGRFPDGAVFMVLEFLKGRDFSDLIEKEGPQPLGRVVHIMEQMCEALQAAHDKGIVHRDMKPENVYLVRRGEDPDFVKVLDFGISKMKASEGESGGGRSMTRTGTAMGTPYYMAPEQAQGKKDLDHRADIYALGVILFRALTGQHPFDHDSYPMLVVKICTEPPPPLRMYRPDVPEAIEQIVARALAKNPNDRYQQCSELRAALAPYREVKVKPVVIDVPKNDAMPTAMTMPQGMGGTGPGMAVGPTTQTPMSTQVPMGTMMPAPPPSRAPWVIAGLAVVALVGGGAGLVGSGAFRPQAPQQPLIVQAPQLPQLPQVPQAVAQPTGPAAPTHAPVNVKIATVPADAEILIDGDRVGSPFDGDLDYSAEPRRLEVRREGYVTVVQDLVLRIPQRITITLTRGAGTDDRREHRAAVRPSGGGTPEQTVAATPEGPTAAVAEEPTERPRERGGRHDEARPAVEAPRETPREEPAAPPPPSEPGPPPAQALKRLRI